MRFVRALVLALVVVLPAFAQDWPSRPVKVVAPYTPGGSADTLGRIVADKLTVRLKQNFLVENRAGAGGLIGADLVAKSLPDGYTLVVSGIASHVIAPATGTPPFDPIRSFTHIALIGGPPIALVVNPGVDATDARQLVAYSQTRPGGLSYGSPGQGTHGHLIAEMFRAQTGAQLTHVPYKGAAPAVADVVAGHLQASFTTLATAAAQIKAGRVRALAITTARRLPDFPDVPTFAELGYKDFVATTWFSISGPAGMPEPVVNLLNAEVRRALAQPDVRERLAVEGIEPNDLDPAAFTEFVRTEIDRWTPIVKSVR